MEYQAIIFDLFGTLVDNILTHQYRQILVEITNILSTEPDRFIDAWLAYSDGRMTGKLNNRDSLELVCRELGLSPTDLVFNDCLNVFADHVGFRLEPPADTLPTLSNLRRRGYDIGLISNCSDEVSFLWESSPLSAVIREPVFSCSVGMKKPDPRIFLLAAGKLDVKPQECIFVDDSAEFLKGAREAGMTAVLIQDRILNSSFSNQDDWDGYLITSIEEMETLIYSVEL